MTLQTTLSYASADDPLLKRVVIEVLEKLTGRPEIERMYDEIKAMNLEPIEVWGKALEMLGVGVAFDQTVLEKIPAEGPVVFIANHPFGVLDGLVLGYLVAQVRQKFVFLVNEVLCRETLLNDFYLPIDFRETRAATELNIKSRRETMDRLKEGQALAIFPAAKPKNKKAKLTPAPIAMPRK